jgi:hypothetical protein
MSDHLYEIYSNDRTRRVVFYANGDGFVGFVEEAWSGEPLERAWIGRRWPHSHCETLDAAIKDASGRIDWLTISQNQISD